MADLKKLQNGSDIRGVAVSTSDGPEVNLTLDVARRISLGFLVFLEEKLGRHIQGLKISVGRDSRISGPSLADAVCEEMSTYGAVVMDAGMASTPAMFMSTLFPEFDADGAIMITASHMPPNRNGMKFFTKDGGLEKADITKILDIASRDNLFSIVSRNEDRASEIRTSHRETSLRAIPLMDRYSDHLRNIIKTALNSQHPLEGIKIAVDAGNGAGGFYATNVLEPLGADISASQFLEPDGTFPNHIPNPEDKKAMEAICERVLETGVDLGLIFDTDVDRASAVDEKGKEIAHNGIVAMAAALIAKDYPGTTVVTDSVTSTQLSSFITETLGLKHLRYKRGYRNVIGKAMELDKAGTDSQLAIETSGHAAFKQNYYLDDGAYLATLIVIEAARLAKEGKGISSVLDALEDPMEEAEFRLPFIGEELERKSIDFSEAGDIILRELEAAVKSGRLGIESNLEEPNYEGTRINFTASDIDGWALLRKSLHDPLMPLNLASNNEGGCKEIAKALKEFLDNYPELDSSQLV